MNVELRRELFVARLTQHRAVIEHDRGHDALAIVPRFNFTGATFVDINISPLVVNMVLVEKRSRSNGVGTP